MGWEDDRTPTREINPWDVDNGDSPEVKARRSAAKTGQSSLEAWE